MSAARDAILARIASALAGDDPAIVRTYRTATREPQHVLVERFIMRAAEYGAAVQRVGRDDLAGAIAAACFRHGARRVAVPPELAHEWRPATPAVVEDRGLSHTQLDALDGAITGSVVAIAETGTVVLDGSGNRGRRALTLLPDLHVCVVPAELIVSSVPEALARLDPSRPITLVSGPSASSDIELERVEGVHGPRRLELLVAG